MILNLPEAIEHNGNVLTLRIHAKGNFNQYRIEYRTKPYSKKLGLYRINSNFEQCIRDMQDYLKELNI